MNNPTSINACWHVVQFALLLTIGNTAVIELRQMPNMAVQAKALETEWKTANRATGGLVAYADSLDLVLDESQPVISSDRPGGMVDRK